MRPEEQEPEQEQTDRKGDCTDQRELSHHRARWNRETAMRSCGNPVKEFLIAQPERVEQGE